MVLNELMREFYDISENQSNKTLIHNNRRNGGDSLVNYSEGFMSYFVISHLYLFTIYLRSHNPFKVVVVHLVTESLCDDAD